MTVKYRQTASSTAHARSVAEAPPGTYAASRPAVLEVKLHRTRSGKASFLRFFEADPLSRVGAIKRGIRPEFVDEIAGEMQLPKERLLGALGLSVATVNRKRGESKPLSKDESERVLGMARLVGQVESMVQASGDPTGFNAAPWLARWLEEPLPALGGHAPAELMDTAEGQAIVSNLLARAQSGAYA